MVEACTVYINSVKRNYHCSSNLNASDNIHSLCHRNLLKESGEAFQPLMDFLSSTMSVSQVAKPVPSIWEW